MQNFNENFIFFAEHHCLFLFTQQWHVNNINIAGTPEFVLVSKNNTSSKFDLVISGSYFYAKFCELHSN